MSVGLVLKRRDAEGIVSPISVTEWKSLIEAHSDLRIRTEPYLGVVPGSGAKITIAIGEADSEIQV